MVLDYSKWDNLDVSSSSSSDEREDDDDMYIEVGGFLRGCGYSSSRESLQSPRLLVRVACKCGPSISQCR